MAETANAPKADRRRSRCATRPGVGEEKKRKKSRLKKCTTKPDENPNRRCTHSSLGTNVLLPCSIE